MGNIVERDFQEFIQEFIRMLIGLKESFGRNISSFSQMTELKMIYSHKFEEILNVISTNSLSQVEKKKLNQRQFYAFSH